MSARVTHLVAYDIAAPARLRRVHRCLAKVGHALQYSVFAVDLTAAERENLTRRLEKIIDPEHDDVRIYRLPDSPVGTWLGPLPLGDGLFLTGSPAASLARRLAEAGGEHIRNDFPVDRTSGGQGGNI